MDRRRQGRVSEGLAYIGMAAERLEKCVRDLSQGKRFTRLHRHEKSATSSPRPKLKGSRSTQSAGAAEHDHVHSEATEGGRAVVRDPSVSSPPTTPSLTERLLTRVVSPSSPLYPLLSRAQSPHVAQADRRPEGAQDRGGGQEAAEQQGEAAPEGEEKAKKRISETRRGGGDCRSRSAMSSAQEKKPRGRKWRTTSL